MALRGASGRLSALGSRLWRGVVTCAIRAHRGGGVDLGSVLKLVLAVDKDDIPRVQSGPPTDAVAGGFGDGDSANLRGVVITGGVDISSLRAALNGGRRKDDEIAFDVDKQVYVDELVGEERVVFVAE